MNKATWDEWLAMPITQEVFRAMKKYRSDMAVSALEDSLIMDSTEQTALAIARRVGYLDGLQALIDGDFTQDE
jgi:hypothetical protein